MGHMNSDSDFAASGKVLSVSRGRYGEPPIGESDMITLVIETGEGNYTADFPVRTRTDLELLPYQSALVGTEVGYSKRFEGPDLLEQWELKILSGPLEGNSFRGTRA